MLSLRGDLVGEGRVGGMLLMSYGMGMLWC